MSESFKENQPVSEGIEIREGEPKIHIVYAYVEQHHLKPGNRIDRIKCIFSDKKIALNEVEAGDLFIDKEDFLEPLNVYERFEDLPEVIKRRVKKREISSADETLREEARVLDTIYAVVPNLESTDGNGFDFVWVLVTDQVLALEIAKGNGVAGSNAHITEVPLNTTIEGRYEPTNLNLRRDSNGEVSDELYLSR